MDSDTPDAHPAPDEGLHGGTMPGALLARTRALLDHARALIGVTLADIADGLGLPVPTGTVSTKGWSGQIIERELGSHEESDRESAPGPDFAALGIELKTVPVDAALRPLESTAVCVIDPVAIAAESWRTSYVRKKLARVLFVALRVPGTRTKTGRGRRTASPSVGDRIVAAVRLWSPSPGEESVLECDFDHIVRGYFRQGRAAALTGHVGTALQVRPKARNNRDLRSAFDDQGNQILVGKSGFYLRPAFVGGILRGQQQPIVPPSRPPVLSPFP